MADFEYQIRKILIYILAIIALLFVGDTLMGADFAAFFRWYMILLLLGVGFYPFSRLVFRDFGDHGWMFSKVLGLLFGGYLTWVLSEAGIVAFTSRRSLVVTVILCGFLWVFFLARKSREMPDIRLILAEEVLFLFLMVLWAYFIGFRPDVNSTEKFMDYGFMAAMDRSYTMPALDMWYGSAGINYYYGGQFYATYLAKLSYTDVSIAYNLMRATVASFAFVLPFVIVCHMMQIRTEGMKGCVKWSALAGITAGTAVSLAGNMHYVLYGLFGRLLKLSGYESYWFPSSTRYIGHNPETADKTIHEFPSYSSILGDLHAHYINIIFVLTLIGLLFAWVRSVHEREEDLKLRMMEQEEKQKHRPDRFVPVSVMKGSLHFIRDTINEPRLIIAAFMIGVFRWTNYWDYIIYYTAALFCIISAAAYRHQHRPLRMLGAAAVNALEVYIISTAAALPFTLRFDTMVTGIALARNHSALYQLAVLWALPAAVFLLLIAVVMQEYRIQYGRSEEKKEGRGERFWLFFRMVSQPDRFALILGICACGLILIPELVYVRDIYEEGYARSNTMFKLTYQAYILFGIMMSYALVRILLMAEKKAVRYAAAFLCMLFTFTVGYFPYSVHAWFGNVLNPSGYKGLCATAYLDEAYPDDAGAIRWLDSHVVFQPIVLEAYGDSYSEYCRVSAMTGLPTVEGWYVHEWLWRSDPEDLNEKRLDIDEIYTSEDEERVSELVKDYNISYIFIGSCEREKYPEISEEILRNLGTVVYEEGSTCVIRIAGSEAERMFPHIVE